MTTKWLFDKSERQQPEFGLSGFACHAKSKSVEFFCCLSLLDLRLEARGTASALARGRSHLRTQQRARPKRGTEDQYEKILGEYSFGEFMLVAAGSHVQSDGKVPTPVCARADAWLRRVASSSPRAVLGISEPTEAERKKQAAFQGKARAKVVSWVT